MMLTKLGFFYDFNRTVILNSVSFLGLYFLQNIIHFILALTKFLKTIYEYHILFMQLSFNSIYVKFICKK